MNLHRRLSRASALAVFVITSLTPLVLRAPLASAADCGIGMTVNVETVTQQRDPIEVDLGAGRDCAGMSVVIAVDGTTMAKRALNSHAQLVVSFPARVGMTRVTATLADGETAGVQLPDRVRPNVPTRPRTVAASGRDRHVVVTWRVPSDDGGRAVGGYAVQVSPCSFRSRCHRVVTSASASTLRIVARHLTSGHKYWTRVRSHNSVGHGHWSLPAMATTPGSR